jgi:acyl carrier protein
MDAEREFLDFVAALFGVDPAALSPATAYGSLPEWDSVMQLRLVMEFEARYGVAIALEEVPELTTLGQFLAKIGKGGA